MIGLPHTRPKGQTWVRVCGDVRVTMRSNDEHGLPFGSRARLILLVILKEAVNKQVRSFGLGPIGDFCEELGLRATGGREGSIEGIRRQFRALSSTSIQVSTSIPRYQVANTFIFSRSADWCRHGHAHVELSEEFYKATLRSPVPIDKAELMALRESPLAMDVFCWSSWRYWVYMYQKSKYIISLDVESMMGQFGAAYANCKAGSGGRSTFIRRLTEATNQISLIAPHFGLSVCSKGLSMKPRKKIEIVALTDASSSEKCKQAQARDK